MVIPEDPFEVLQCNVRDVTKERAARLVPLIEKTLDHITESLLKRMLIGESHNLSTPNDMHLKMAKFVPKLTRIPIGNKGGGFEFSDSFCPQNNKDCMAPLAYSAREWPFITHSYADGSNKLAPGTKILDLIMYDKKLERLDVSDQADDIITSIPRTAGKMGNSSLPDFELVNATYESANQLIKIVYTNFNITKNGSSVNLEIIPVAPNPRLFIIVSKPRLPTLTDFEYFKYVTELSDNNGTYEWFFPPTALNGTGRYFVGIGEFKPSFNLNLMNDPKGNNVSGSALQNVSTNYHIRIYTSGCYFFNSSKKEWQSTGMKVTHSNHLLTTCNTSHLTSFGSGMFVMPNTIDFNYVFANMGFADNLTIYLTLIMSLSIFILLMIWARMKDKKDTEKLGATPLPDNKVEDKYFYEVLVFTGNVRGAQTDSLVQFIVSGEEDETDVRTFADPKRKILRKDAVDVFVMAVSRPLGPLQFLRIWHDNSGKGPNASWYLSYIVFRDVQSGEKFEFIANQWLGVEYDDGQIDRLLPVAGAEQKRQFKHLFNTTKNKNLSDGHLWFSVFLRPARSRFTRCQRVGSCFALLFLSMLVNAMWYDRVPEQPGTGGLNFGPFSLSPEQSRGPKTDVDRPCKPDIVFFCT
ncbi:hypothetical protein SK128_002079 [Halocaridina rubra]|uniref:PLAT domain-containing protein n=1 Tax=Halocaridina rubra TaxID=373956 RepID=A0AAN8WZP9_HALRR